MNPTTNHRTAHPGRTFYARCHRPVVRPVPELEKLGRSGAAAAYGIVPGSATRVVAKTGGGGGIAEASGAGIRELNAQLRQFRRLVFE